MLARILPLLTAAVLAAGCASSRTTKTTAALADSRSATPEARPTTTASSYTKPQPYDPPGSTVTTSRAISAQSRRTFAIAGDDLAVGTNFDGARLNGIVRLTDSDYVGMVAPENVPINNSAWYAFKLWSPERRRVRFHLRYQDGDHRYHPRISHDGANWNLLAGRDYVRDSITGDRVLLLDVGPDTLWVAAQELVTSHDVDRWVGTMAALPWVRFDTIGASMLGRPLLRMEVTESPAADQYVFVIGRQHPPEVTGSLALRSFVETVAGTSELARRFRRRFKLVVVPMVNPDGVDAGHWRHNAGGVDLNRDWFAFNQPETRAVRDAFLHIRDSLGGRARFAVDFHSTWSDIIYTLDSSLVTDPPDFTGRWIDEIEWEVPGYTTRREPDGLESPIFKSWFYREFGGPVVTYEVGDGTSRTRLDEVAAAAANAMMRMLLNEE